MFGRIGLLLVVNVLLNDEVDVKIDVVVGIVWVFSFILFDKDIC